MATASTWVDGSDRRFARDWSRLRGKHGCQCFQVPARVFPMILVRLSVRANEHHTETGHTYAPASSAPYGGSRNGIPEGIIQILDQQPTPSITQSDRFGRFGR
jgi:hypothetical protein